MLRITALIALFAGSTLAMLLVTTTSSCTITTVNGEGEGEGAAAGEGEGAVAGEGEGAVAGEGEGEGAGAKENACTTGNCCGDGIDNDGNGFTDCKDFACAGDAACDQGVQPIQAFMDPNGTITPVAGVTIDKAVVIGTHTSASGNINVWIQMADGDTGGTTDTYPKFSGTNVFIKSGTPAATQFAGLNLAIGDCVTVKGSVDVEKGHSDDELSFISNIAKTTGCGATPTPSTQTIDKINDTGSDKLTFIDTLVTVQNVTCDLASSGNNGSFEIKDAAGNKIFVSGFLMNPKPNTAANATFTSVTGILEEFVDSNTTPPTVHFDIDPRQASDLVP